MALTADTAAGVIVAVCERKRACLLVLLLGQRMESAAAQLLVVFRFPTAAAAELPWINWHGTKGGSAMFTCGMLLTCMKIKKRPRCATAACEATGCAGFLRNMMPLWQLRI
jgi:hypothetical protein